MKRIAIHFIAFWMLCSSAWSQVSVSTDQSDPHPSAALDIRFTNKGFLPPRLSHQGMDSIENPANGLIVFCTDCGTAGSGCLAIFMNSGWRKLETGCIQLSTPVQGSHIITGTTVTWNWLPVPGATGYKWSTADNYAGATDLGNVTSRTESGLSCNTFYVRYVWAYNACGQSSAVTLTATTLTCTWSCGQPFNDSRDNTSYGTVLIGSQCWMSQNLNIGTRINGFDNQANNGTIEKYCYNDLSTNCGTYGGLYQWAEAVQYLNGATNTGSWLPEPQGNVQGICPSGWHLPSHTELYTLLGAVTIPAGGSLKETGTTHWASPNTGATNSSGFTGLPGGFRLSDGGFSSMGIFSRHWTTGQGPLADAALTLGLSSSSGDADQYFMYKVLGISVRCIKNQ